MHVLVYLPLVVPALAALGARPLAERLPPRTATWLLTLSAVALAAASCAVLGLLALAAAMRLPAVDSLGRLSFHAMSHIDPAPVPLGVIAAGLLAAPHSARCARRGCGPQRWSRHTGRHAACRRTAGCW